MRILMLEDDPRLSQLVADTLRLHFRVDAVGSYEEAADHIERYRYDVVLLDRNIDEMDVGMQLVPRIKGKNASTGIIIVSAYDTIADKITGLNLGADDYLDKPFDTDELLARIHALCRRHAAPTVTLGPLVCHTVNRSIHCAAEEIMLSKKESDLFFYLLSQRGRIVSKEELLDALYVNPQNISSNTIDVTLANIRRKLPETLIRTVKTRGYVIE